MRKWTLATLMLMIVTSFGLSEAAAAPLKLDAPESVRAFGAASYSVDLESDVKTVQLLDRKGRQMADLMISLDPKDGTLLDFRMESGAHISVLWREDLEGGMIVTDRATGEVVVLDAEPGENNQGEGVALIDNHRESIDLLGALYTDVVRQVLDGEDSAGRDQERAIRGQDDAISEQDNAIRGKRDSNSDVVNTDPTCFGGTQTGFGSSFTTNVSAAAAEARQDCNNKCTNQWCWGCCRIDSTICKTVLFFTSCTAYGTRCSAPIPCV